MAKSNSITPAQLQDALAKTLASFGLTMPDATTILASAPQTAALLPMTVARPVAPVDPNRMVRGTPSGIKVSKWGNNYETVTYTYGGASFQAFTSAVSKPTAVGDPVLVDSKGHPITVSGQADSFTVLAILPCRMGKGKAEPVRVPAERFPEALSLITAPDKPSASIVIARSGSNG